MEGHGLDGAVRVKGVPGERAPSQLIGLYLVGVGIGKMIGGDGSPRRYISLIAIGTRHHKINRALLPSRAAGRHVFGFGSAARCLPADGKGGEMNPRSPAWLRRLIDTEEAWAQLRFAAPMVLTNMSYYGIPLVSVMFSGHLGNVPRSPAWLRRLIDTEEAWAQLRFAAPMVLTNMSYYGIPLVSVMFSGHLGNVHLAGATLGNSWATVTGYAFVGHRWYSAQQREVVLVCEDELDESDVFRRHGGLGETKVDGVLGVI
ncbi:MATE efflux family protein ALF5 [Triticum urartu]|uniref:MATE efflux family protein ALF5 n=1 Tax=Triticum urartu TaxID=4572 RepID=M8AH95_TRIUA|nr:MATE efflux family protein ALF5 [Triticum urartu]